MIKTGKTNNKSKRLTKKNNNTRLLNLYKSKPNLQNVNIDTFTDNFKGFTINFTTYNVGKLKNAKKYYVFSVCYFVMEKSEALQKSKKYVKNLKILIKNIKKNLPNYKIRIYCDKPAVKNIEEFINDNKVELFIYEIPSIVNSKGYHKGYLGTILRYFPFFDLPKHKGDIVVCYDIDSQLTYNIITIIKNRIDTLPFVFYSHSCYHTSARYKDMGNIIFPIMGGFITANTSKLLFPKYVLTDFFINYLVNDNLHYETYIKLFLDYEKNKESKLPQIYLKSKKERPHITDMSMAKYVYGVDEYFLNNQIRRYLLLNKIKVYYHVFPSQLYNTFLRLICDIYFTENIKLNKELYKLCGDYLNVIPISIYQKKLTDKSTITDYFENFYYIFLAFKKLQSLNNSIKGKIYTKIIIINKKILSFINKNLNNFGYEKSSESYGCIYNGLNFNYNNYLNITPFIYTQNNTSFISSRIDTLTDKELKDMHINKNEVIKYFKSNKFLQFNT